MGFEPTTSCLEGKSSTAELHPHSSKCEIADPNARIQTRFDRLSIIDFDLRISDLREWVGRDSNPRTPKRPDLQSGAIDHSATYP